MNIAYHRVAKRLNFLLIIKHKILRPLLKTQILLQMISFVIAGHVNFL